MTEPEQPGDVIAQITVVAEAEVIPGPETLAKQAAEREREQEREQGI
jgi:hypothetical protein